MVKIHTTANESNSIIIMSAKFSANDSLTMNLA